MRQKLNQREMLKTRAHINKDVLLKLLKAGVVLVVALTAPNAIRMLKPLIDDDYQWDKFYPSSIERTTLRLWRKGFVEIKKTSDGYLVQITKRGMRQVFEYDVDSMSIPIQDKWDRKWRMVFFDIPAKEKVRDVFRRQLVEMGFFQMQKSVYVFPYPCSSEIQFLREVYGIPHKVKLAVVEKIENDQDLRHIFHL